MAYLVKREAIEALREDEELPQYRPESVVRADE